MDRRAFLSSGIGALASAPLLRAANERVGVGVSPNPYAATLRAVIASGTWPYVPVANRKVILKPNLVARAEASSGITTDPEVTRAIVDLCLAGGATDIRIIETAALGAAFAETGYLSTFGSYNPAVKLVDTATEPHALLPVPGGVNVASLRLPSWMQDPDVTFISIGKLKTHRETVMTLSSKNLFGLPEINSYISTPGAGRFALHDRGTGYSIVDLNRSRPIHYAVIDGIWGLEGAGPVYGTPIRMDVVLAGLNAVAVDRIGAFATETPQEWVRHLTYLSGAGFGPAGVNAITVAGDPLPTKPFVKTTPPPLLDKPYVAPNAINPSLGQTATIYQAHYENSVRKVEIVKLSDESATVEIVREIIAYSDRAPGLEIVQWDGRDAGGQIVPPGRYAAHTRAYSLKTNVRHADSINWIDVVS